MQMEDWSLPDTQPEFRKAHSFQPPTTLDVQYPNRSRYSYIAMGSSCGPVMVLFVSENA
jgi:hypothetical protein